MNLLWLRHLKEDEGESSRLRLLGEDDDESSQLQFLGEDEDESSRLQHIGEDKDGFIDESIPTHPKTFFSPITASSLATTQTTSSSITEISNPLFKDWQAKDQVLVSLINPTISVEALAYVAG